MNTRAKSRRAWRTVRDQLGASGGDATIPKALFPHPRDAGARPTATWPAGQIAEYAIDDPSGNAPLVVQEYGEHFEAFIDGVQLTARAARVADENPTAAMYLGGALLGGAVAAALSNKREGALVGAGLGLLFAALLHTAMEEKTAR